jgi:hypothetical protein
LLGDRFQWFSRSPEHVGKPSKRKFKLELKSLRTPGRGRLEGPGRPGDPAAKGFEFELPFLISPSLSVLIIQTSKVPPAKIPNQCLKRKLLKLSTY